jgi:hypothetical protein
LGGAVPAGTVGKAPEGPCSKGRAAPRDGGACELPTASDFLCHALSLQEIRQHVISQGLAEISGATLWRWLSTDALCPWRHQSWIFPRDPNFAANAGPVLDLYERIWEGTPLGAYAP